MLDLEYLYQQLEELDFPKTYIPERETKILQAQWPLI